ncbi:MAG: DUF2249 domain-containing protein [Jhaorihella sp.]
MTGAAPGKHWQAADGLHLDTRGLAPPDPMIAVLWHIEQPGQNGPITVYLDRNPVYLFPELAERAWRYEIVSDEPGDVRIVLRPQK